MVQVQETAKYESTVLRNKTENAKSVLTIRPRREDDGVVYSCQSSNVAAPVPLESVVVLSVLRKLHQWYHSYTPLFMHYGDRYF